MTWSCKSNTGRSKLVFTVLKKLLATKSTQKTTSKNTIDQENIERSFAKVL